MSRWLERTPAQSEDARCEPLDVIHSAGRGEPDSQRIAFQPERSCYSRRTHAVQTRQKYRYRVQTRAASEAQSDAGKLYPAPDSGLGLPTGLPANDR
jgi:hypothetical protein